MLAFIIAQVLIASYAYLIANKEACAILERRDYVPINSPYDDPWHTYGAFARGVVLILASLVQNSVHGYVLAPIAGGLILWVIYDLIIGEEVYNDPYYLGTTSKIDAWLGAKAGRRKVQIAGAVVVLLNVLYFIL